MRWNEELHLLGEELRRIQVSFTKEAERRESRRPLDQFAAYYYGPRPQRGYEAYGLKQAHAYRRLAEDALAVRRKLGLTEERDLQGAIDALTNPPPVPVVD